MPKTPKLTTVVSLTSYHTIQITWHQPAHTSLTTAPHMQPRLPGVRSDAGGGVVSAPFLEAAELGLGRNRRIEDSVRVGLHDAHRDRPRVVAHERYGTVPLVRRTVEARARLAPEAAYLILVA